MKNIEQIKTVINRLINVEYFIVSLKFFQFRAPYETPETVIVAIPTAMQGMNAIVINLHAMVNDATSVTPAVIMIRKLRIMATNANMISSVAAGSETTRISLYISSLRL